MRTKLAQEESSHKKLHEQVVVEKLKRAVTHGDSSDSHETIKGKILNILVLL